MIGLASGAADPHSLIDIQRAHLLKGLHEITRHRSSADPSRGLAGSLLRDKTAMHLEADLRWLDLIESRLTFRCMPDLVIKTGGQHLTDFLIWLSVYSELFFSDVNWKYFRRIDFLRALRDFQFRERRFGG